jgi:hypothetical protein
MAGERARRRTYAAASSAAFAPGAPPAQLTIVPVIVVSFAQAAGQKRWYLARDEAELETVLARILVTGQCGYSDRIEAYATREFPHR